MADGVPRRLLHGALALVAAACSTGRTPMREVSAVIPRYPPVLVNAGVQGITDLTFRILPDGSVDPASIVATASTNRAFVEPAVDAARKWRFEPAKAKRGGQRYSARVAFVIDTPCANRSRWSTGGGRPMLSVVQCKPVLIPREQLLRNVAARAAANVVPIEVEVVAHHLDTPWSMAFAPDGRLFVAERVGRIRVIRRDSLQAAPWATLAVHASARDNIETGLMGLAIDPQFTRNGRVYVCYTARSASGALDNRIGVVTEQQGRGGTVRDLVAGIPAGRYHNGCRLSFGPDGKLYATTGDAGETRQQGEAAQSLESLAGKVLRLNADGSIPADNPFTGSYIWSLGHRNAQGLAWEPRTGRLLATEHGTGDGGNNEVNVIVRGGNYGWPVVIGDVADDRFVRPIFVGPDAPAGATFVRSSRFGNLAGDLVVATLSARRLLRVSTGEHPVARVLIDTTYGRLRDVIEGPDGLLYVATSNRDGRGTPAADDDRILRVRPSQR